MDNINDYCQLSGCDESFENESEAVAHYESEHDGVVYIDTREKDTETIKEVARVCEEKETGFISKHLESGDYVYHGDQHSVAIEYKNIDDAVSSSLNDRLHKQADAMAEEYDRAFIFMVGKMSEVDLHNRNIGYAQAYGQIVGEIPVILSTMNIPTIWLRERDKFADIGMRTLLFSGNKGLEDNEVLLVSPGVAEDPRLAMIMGINGVGESAAKSLLGEFDGLEGLMNASYVEIKEVDGFGPTTAKKIYNTLHAGFEETGFNAKEVDGPMWEFFETSGIGDDILYDVWEETDGLSDQPFEYVDKEYDLGSHRREILEDAIEKVRTSIELNSDSPNEELPPEVIVEQVRGYDTETQRQIFNQL